MKIEIETMSDYYDCDEAGCSGGCEEGGIVKVDGDEVFSHIPSAGCYENVDYSPMDLIVIALLSRGITVEIDGSPYSSNYTDVNETIEQFRNGLK